MATQEVRVEWTPRGIAKLGKAVADSRKLLKRLGEMMVSDAQKAFQDQAFGTIKWKPKYPNQSEPFISIAGVVQDFGVEGRTKPRSETLERLPALHRTADLRNSVAARAIGSDAVEIGSPLAYAGKHQKGGLSTQPWSEDGKERLADWLYGWKGKRVFVPHYAQEQKRGERGRSKYETIKTQPNIRFEKKLKFLLKPQTTELSTMINARPFIGLTDERAQDAAKTIADFIAEKAVA